MFILTVKKLVMACAALAMLLSPAFAELKVGDTAPDFSVKNAEGRTEFTLSEYKGNKIIYLDFFATWCTNCQEEMDQLKAIHSRYGGQGLEMVAIDVQEDEAKMKKFVAKYGIPFRVLLDPDAAIARKYGLAGFPFNLIIDGNGKIVFMDSAPPRDFGKLFEPLKGTIAQKEAPKTRSHGAKPVKTR